MQLVNLKKSYNDRSIFQKINYTFENGKIYWLKGENGIGKSTFLRSLIGIEKFTEGQIINLPKKILYIPEVELTEKWLTIKENITFLYKIAAINPDPNIEINKALNITPTDFNTMSMDCSTGTNMKIGFSLLYSENHWDLIIIDEAFSHIDLNTQNSLLQKLIDLSTKTNCIVIFIHHDDISKIFDDKIITLTLRKDGIYESK